MCVDEATFTNNQNHLVGPQVEFAYPRELESNEDLSAQLPFMALPDGSHMVCDTQLTPSLARTTAISTYFVTHYDQARSLVSHAIDKSRRTSLLTRGRK